MTTQTGNRRGAPRIGEIRIDTPGAKRQRERREANPELAREQNRINSAKYRAKNRAKIAVLSKAERVRRKEREANPELLKTLIVAKAGAIITPNIRIRVAYKE